MDKNLTGRREQAAIHASDTRTDNWRQADLELASLVEGTIEEREQALHIGYTKALFRTIPSTLKQWRVLRSIHSERHRLYTL